MTSDTLLLGLAVFVLVLVLVESLRRGAGLLAGRRLGVRPG